MRKIIVMLLLLIGFLPAFAGAIHIENLMPSEDIEYVFRLTNGDVLTATVLEVISGEEKTGVKLKTMIGNAIIYENEIAEIRLREDYYRHSSRVYLLPTALPIADDHYLGNFELGLFMAGVGITKYVSVTVGRTILPIVYPDQQITLANIKGSYHAVRFEDIPADLYIGFGGNLAFLNDDNRLVHYYVNSTYLGDKSSVTATVFYKAGSQEYFLFHYKNEFTPVIYPDGTFGIGLGLDTKFSDRNDLRFIGEVWNSDVNKPTSSLIMLGLRLAGTKFSADFGLAFFMEPMAVPFFSFVWTPM